MYRGLDLNDLLNEPIVERILKNGIVVVEICDGSLITEIDLEKILESEFPEVAVIESSCLSFCGMCAKRPYAIVNGKRIFAKTVEECLDKIRNQIKVELAVFS